jgi:hypothetical protein
MARLINWGTVFISEATRPVKDITNTNIPDHQQAVKASWSVQRSACTSPKVRWADKLSPQGHPTKGRFTKTPTMKQEIAADNECGSKDGIMVN